MKLGYLVRLSEQTSFFYREVPGDNIVDHKPVLCSRKKLVELLQDQTHYFIKSAQLIDVTEYQPNHQEEPLEEWGF